jgi:hypothetical protein
VARPGVTLILTGKRIERGVERLEPLYRLAREICPDKFTAEETQEPRELLDHLSLACVDGMRREIAEKVDLPLGIMSLDRFSVYSCGPIALHDDKHNYPDLYFVIVIVHSGRLGVVDRKTRSVRHQPGEILLLDPHKKHALIPEGMTVKDYRYEKTHSPVHAEEDQFLFLSFDVRRRDLRPRFRPDGTERGSESPRIGPA